MFVILAVATTVLRTRAHFNSAFDFETGGGGGNPVRTRVSTHSYERVRAELFSSTSGLADLWQCFQLFWNRKLKVEAGLELTETSQVSPN